MKLQNSDPKLKSSQKNLSQLENYKSFFKYLLSNNSNNFNNSNNKDIDKDIESADDPNKLPGLRL